MISDSYCRARADECLARAKQVCRSDVEREWRSLSDAWHDLARHVAGATCAEDQLEAGDDLILCGPPETSDPEGQA
jgi:hypothetical protein